MKMLLPGAQRAYGSGSASPVRRGPADCETWLADRQSLAFVCK